MGSTSNITWRQIGKDTNTMNKLLFLSINFITVIIFITVIFPNPTYAKVDISKEYDFGDLQTLGQGVDRLVGPAFGIATTAVVVYFIYAAFKYLTSGGDKEAIASAQKMVTHSIIGFVLLMFLFLAINFIMFRLLGTGIMIFKGF